MGFLYLLAAITFEGAGTTALKFTEGFTRLLPSIVFIICYAISFFNLSQALKSIDLGIAYAIWSAVGVALIAILGVIIFKEPVNPIKIISLILIISGVVGLKLSSSFY